MKGKSMQRKVRKTQNDQSFNVHQKELIMRQPPSLHPLLRTNRVRKSKNKIKGQSPKKTNK